VIIQIGQDSLQVLPDEVEIGYIHLLKRNQPLGVQELPSLQVRKIFDLFPLAFTDFQEKGESEALPGH
jgi:hypothetical protein